MLCFKFLRCCLQAPCMWAITMINATRIRIHPDDEHAAFMPPAAPTTFASNPTTNPCCRREKSTPLSPVTNRALSDNLGPCQAARYSNDAHQGTPLLPDQDAYSACPARSPAINLHGLPFTKGRFLPNRQESTVVFCCLMAPHRLRESASGRRNRLSKTHVCSDL